MVTEFCDDDIEFRLIDDIIRREQGLYLALEEIKATKITELMPDILVQNHVLGMFYRKIDISVDNMTSLHLGQCDYGTG